MNLLNYKAYFEELAATDPLLLHTVEDPALFMRSPQDAAGAITTRGERLSVLLAPYDKRPKTNASENHVWLKQGFIMVLGPVRPDDYDHQVEVQNLCEQVIDRFYKKMYYDRGNPRGNPKLYGFDIASWNCDAVGPVVDNHYGYAAVFDIKDAIDLIRP